MARLAGEKGAIRSLGNARHFAAEANAKARLERATARKRSDRCLVLNRRGIHRRPFRALALRDGILYVRVLQPSLHYELERIAKTEILSKLKQRFGGKTIRDLRFRLG